MGWGWPTFKCGRNGGNGAARTNPRKPKCKMAARNFYSFSALSLARSLSLCSALMAFHSRMCVGVRARGSPASVLVCVSAPFWPSLHFVCKVKLSDNFKSRSSARFYEYIRPSATHLLFYENGKMRRQMLPGVALARRMRLQ